VQFEGGHAEGLAEEDCVLSVPHEAQVGKSEGGESIREFALYSNVGLPLLLLPLNPLPPNILEITRVILHRLLSHSLTITSPYQVNQQAVEEVRHVVLFLACSGFAKTFD
jgi:hypothetical protein